jgi:hypothetical protein
MQTPLQIAFRNLDWSEAIAAKIGERAAKPENCYERIMAAALRWRRSIGTLAAAAIISCASM